MKPPCNPKCAIAFISGPRERNAGLQSNFPRALHHLSFLPKGTAVGGMSSAPAAGVDHSGRLEMNPWGTFDLKLTGFKLMTIFRTIGVPIGARAYPQNGIPVGVPFGKKGKETFFNPNRIECWIEEPCV